MEKKYALVSLYNKKYLNYLCKIFVKNNIEIISTGNTSEKIKKLGFKYLTVSSLIKFKEILEGRVKTLHPKIYASLLFSRNKTNHLNEFRKLKFPKIDFVFINLYPFNKKPDGKKNFEDCIELIDIGGVSILRAAAKNFSSVTPICDPNDYKKFATNLNMYDGKTSFDFRKKMALKVFKLTSNYDLKIFEWLTNKKNMEKNFYNTKKNKLRYGENPHQKAFYITNGKQKTIYNGIIKNNKNLSYNNILDIESALECINEFNEPSCAIIKHNNPCGVSSNKNIITSFKNAYASDSVSAFGGIVIINRKMNIQLAKKISKYFFEIIIATSFDKNSIKLYEKKNNTILIETKNFKQKNFTDIKKVHGGYLTQEKNTVKFTKNNLKLVSEKKANAKLIDDIVFAFKVCKHVKSNAIVLAKNKTVVGIGAGQMSRIDATKVAIKKLTKINKNSGFIAASDAFFPFVDNIILLIKNNCNAIVQPSGSIKDQVIIKYANKNKIALYFSKYRFFKH